MVSGGVPKWLKGLASNTSRSVAPAQGFKSLLLRCEEKSADVMSADFFSVSALAREKLPSFYSLMGSSQTGKVRKGIKRSQ